MGSSLAMRQLFTKLERVAAGGVDVLLTGETGTGKELCARAIHQKSGRTGEFVVLDLAGSAPSLIESEFFGHVKGAFTGADTGRMGAFEHAHRGTVFLDEVGELPLELQPRLLRALESREVKPVGGGAYRKLNFHFIAATHRDLQAQVRANRFREDLFHRLSGVTVELPPLRQRSGDIEVLVNAMLLKRGLSTSAVSAETRSLLAGYHWPGNVRELRNVVEQVLSLGTPPELRSIAQTLAPHAPFKLAKEQMTAAFERDYLKHLLERHQGNVTRCAEDSGLTRVHLYRLFKKYGLELRES